MAITKKMQHAMSVQPLEREDRAACEGTNIDICFYFHSQKPPPLSHLFWIGPLKFASYFFGSPAQREEEEKKRVSLFAL